MKKITIRIRYDDLKHLYCNYTCLTGCKKCDRLYKLLKGTLEENREPGDKEEL
jgi:hypothetical protein